MRPRLPISIYCCERSNRHSDRLADHFVDHFADPGPLDDDELPSGGSAATGILTKATFGTDRLVKNQMGGLRSDLAC